MHRCFPKLLALILLASYIVEGIYYIWLNFILAAYNFGVKTSARQVRLLVRQHCIQRYVWPVVYQELNSVQRTKYGAIHLRKHGQARFNR